MNSKTRTPEAGAMLPTRRTFLHHAAATAGAVGAFTILPSREVAGQRKLAPSDKLNLGADKVIFTRAAATPRAADPEDLQKMFQERSGKMSQIARTVPEAVEMAVRGVSREDLVCVTGSFYVVGEALKYLSERK